MPILLLLSVFVISTCGLVYELISGALASYLLGDSITQFSTVIGTYLFAMGIGSFFSKYFHKNLLSTFVKIEILIGLIGGSSACILFLSFEHISSFRSLLYFMVGIPGSLVGLEVPLLMRILKNRFEFKDLVSKVFTFDYIGALFASLIFPLFLVPYLGLMRSSFLFGIINVLVALFLIQMLRSELERLQSHFRFAIFSLIALTLGFIYSDRLLEFSEASAFPDKVIYAKNTHYQRIVLTSGPHDMRLYLNGNLQFSSRDEYRYHEALVHVGLGSIVDPKRVLILGGGDGLAVREILKYASVDSITLVDLDPEMTRLFSTLEPLLKLNESSLLSSKVKVINEDAFLWLHEKMKSSDSDYDFIVVDFPDPSNFSIGKLYSTSFYKMLKTFISSNGVIVIQSTSPYVAKKSFWCIDATLKSVDFFTTPYHAYIPSFGEWGFVLATKQPFVRDHNLISGLRFLSADSMQALFSFPKDMLVENPEINKLNNQSLVRFFEDEWSDYSHN